MTTPPAERGSERERTLQVGDKLYEFGLLNGSWRWYEERESYRVGVTPEEAALLHQLEATAAGFAPSTLTGCCIACGDRLDLTPETVNGLAVLRVRMHCPCNQGVRLWPSTLRAALAVGGAAADAGRTE